MMQATPQPSLAQPTAEPAVPTLRRGWEVSALGALFWLTLRQYSRGRRLLIVCLLFTLPSLVAIIVRSARPSEAVNSFEMALILTLIPHTLLPLTALLYAAGMIQDEIEDQTLTYLLIRPLPKWAIYLTKLLATVVLTVLVVTVFTVATYLAMAWGRPNPWEDILVVRALKTASLYALCLVGYCSLIGCLSLFTRWPLVVGVAYIILFEGILANVPFAVRHLTVMYYFRVLAQRWLSGRVSDWSIDLATAPSALSCVSTIVAASLAATAVAALAFSAREFRVKTPEGN